MSGAEAKAMVYGEVLLIREMRPVRSPNEVGLIRHMKPEDTPYEAGIDAKRDRFSRVTRQNDCAFGSGTYYLYILDLTVGLSF